MLLLFAVSIVSTIFVYIYFSSWVIEQLSTNGFEYVYYGQLHIMQWLWIDSSQQVITVNKQKDHFYFVYIYICDIKLIIKVFIESK